jgi:Na+-transporting methylmalonyl-CoA/oxaloacetate decarboxylase gamma subunit
MENLGWGLEITVLGMGLVFALLALLWAALHLVLKLEPAGVESVSAATSVVHAERIGAVADDAIGAQVPVPPTVQGMDADLVAAITVATLAHRAVCRLQAAPAMRSAWPGSDLHTSRWVTSGRMRQNRNWNPRGR